MSANTARYAVIVSPEPDLPSTLHCDVRRLVPARDAGPLMAGPLARRALAEFSDGHELHIPFDEFVTPDHGRVHVEDAVTDRIRTCETGTFYVTYDWRDEPVTPANEASGVGSRYAEHGRRRWPRKRRAVNQPR